MVESLKKVTISYDPFKGDEILRINLKVERNEPYVSSEWPSRIILWLSRRYHVVSAYFGMVGDNSFVLYALIVCDKDCFRHWSHKALLSYVRQLVK